MTFKRHFAHAAMLLPALALASCSTRRPAPRPAPVVTPAPSPKPAAALSPAAYVATLGSIDLFVVRASDMALSRSADPAVRALATQLGDEHRGLAAQLSMAGRRLGTLPAARLLDREERMLALLDREPSFDAAFRRYLGVAHTRSWDAHAAFALRGSSPTLRPVAANGERVERAHLALLGRG